MNRKVYILTICISIVILALTFFLPFKTDSYKTEQLASVVDISVPRIFEVSHIKTPTPVKAIYMSGWVAGTPKLRNKLVDLIDKTEINSVVIDIKDYTGKISFEVDNPKLKAYKSTENRIPDIKEFIGRLHEKGIYVIGRISSFQDSYLVKTHPELAVTDKSGKLWKDRKGIAWIDVGAKPAWEYLALIGQEAYDFGFDELNFDYIRYPSDGNMENISFPFSNGKSKPVALKEFYAFLDKTFRPKGIPISADLFGMTTSNNNDLGIGQILGDALVHFDFVAPMVYPSHYPKNFLGYTNSAKKPYEIIKYAMENAVIKAEHASTSPNKLRPWLQDFSLGGVEYDAEMVRAQIQASYDTGLHSWMLWNASNVYTESALKPKSETVDKAISPDEKKVKIKKVD